MSQPRRLSAIEAVTGTGIGYVVAVLAQLAVFPLFGIAASVADNLAIAAVFTAISVARGYLVRRMFNAIGGSA